ncbi:MAG: cytidylate kinase [Mariniblastus sp.]|jgi:cytidylate kinase
MIVTIDGPAGAGKSSVTRQLARKLDFEFLDTGAMYRAVTWCAISRGIALSDQAVLRSLAEEIEIEFDDDQVTVNGHNVTAEIRDPEITRQVVFVADAPAVRAHLVLLQRRIAEQGNFVCEGRDQGSVAFPDAFCKIFLTASARARALRRAEQMKAAGQFVDFDQVVREQDVRDEQDLNRDIGPLVKANDAIEVNTDHQTLEQVVERLVSIVKSRLSKDSGDA